MLRESCIKGAERPAEGTNLFYSNELEVLEKSSGLIMAGDLHRCGLWIVNKPRNKPTCLFQWEGASVL